MKGLGFQEVIEVDSSTVLKGFRKREKSKM